MHSLRGAVGCVSLAIFSGVFRFAGASTVPPPEQASNVVAAGDSGTQQLHQAGLGTSPAHDVDVQITAFGHDPAVVVRATARADIVVVSSVVPETERLHRRILEYVLERNPNASEHAFRDYPAAVLDEAARSDLDHCLALAQAQTESDFRPDAVGAAGEIGLYQMLPSTAALFEPVVGQLRPPSLKKHKRDLGNLADPVVSTRFAMAYLRDILARKPRLRDALTEYNGGPRGRQPDYYRTVMATYVELLERPELGCRIHERRVKPPLLGLARG